MFSLGVIFFEMRLAGRENGRARCRFSCILSIVCLGIVLSVAHRIWQLLAILATTMCSPSRPAEEMWHPPFDTSMERATVLGRFSSGSLTPS